MLLMAIGESKPGLIGREPRSKSRVGQPSVAGMPWNARSAVTGGHRGRARLVGASLPTTGFGPLRRGFRRGTLGCALESVGFESRSGHPCEASIPAEAGA